MQIILDRFDLGVRVPEQIVEQTLAVDQSVLGQAPRNMYHAWIAAGDNTQLPRHVFDYPLRPRQSTWALWAPV